MRRLSDHDAEALLHDWSFLARPSQLPPPGDWHTFLMLGGRGAGKTRAGAEWVRAKVKAGCYYIGLIAPTAADARDVMVEGESGLLSVCWAEDRDRHGTLMGVPVYEPSKRRISWANGARATLFSAAEPERLRGPQHAAIWADEAAAWVYPEAMDMALFGLRLGAHPQIMITTTPKPVRLIRDLLAAARTPGSGVVVTTGSTFENRANLATTFVAQIVRKYEGTRLGRQELYAELLAEAEGALWTRESIEANRVTAAPEMRRVVVAIDPAVSKTDQSDETGIVVAGRGVDGKGYIFADVSGRYSPDGWARKALLTAEAWGADRVIGETNNGGDLIGHTLRVTAQAMVAEGVRRSAEVPYRAVHASRAKQARAEPVAALYEQGRVHHVGGFADLEDQMCNWVPLSGLPSPDRVDAAIWALTDLLLERAAPHHGPIGVDKPRTVEAPIGIMF